MKILDASYSVNYETGEPTLHIFGVGGEHKTIENYSSYFYVEFNDHISPEVAIKLLKLHHFYRVKHVKKFRPIGYQKTPRDMYQVFCVSPREIRDARDRASRIPNVFKIYEADILYVSRVLIDNNLGGFSEIGDSKDVPMRYLGFDIECLPPDDGKMPESTKDPVILISMSFWPTYNDSSRIVLTSKSTSYNGCTVIKCADEKDIIKTFFTIFNDYNPDVVAGYNSNPFDFPYIAGRCKVLGIRPQVTRDHRDWYIRGRFDGGVDVTITGRVVVDLLPIIRKNYSLPQYTLREAAKLVKYEKLDISPKEMREAYLSDETGLHVLAGSDGLSIGHRTEKERKTTKIVDTSRITIDNNTEWDRVVAYSDRDAELVMKLMLDLKLIDKYAALSKASGLLLQSVVNAGQTQIIEFMLMQKFLKIGRVMNMRPQIEDDVDEDEIRYEGATVLTPPQKVQENLVILDFTSLYPTIIMAHNISYDTIILQDEVIDEEFETSPSGARFVKSSVLKGVLPEILEELFAKRIDAKKHMKETTGSEREYWDAQQYAYKILLNSYYGYAGYLRARLFTIEVAESVTSYGRVNIEDTINFIKSEGHDVVYGDTDSVFVKFNINYDINQDVKLEQLKQMGSRLALQATERLPAPMELVFEAVALRAIFLAKKHYAMWRFEPTKDGWDSKLKSKGIALVRRDWCPLTGKVMKKCLESILIDGDVQTAAKDVHKVITDIKHLDLKKSQEYINDLLMTKRYKGSIEAYKNKPIHIKLIERMIARGEPEPSTGDRIPFIVINEYSGTFSDKGENPEYAMQKGYTLDTDYYLTRQILPPLVDIFESFGITKDMLIKGIYKREDKPSKQRTLFDL